ncbi:MAG: hypothetical protein KAR03_10290 [Candidatus Thorarchaeota archaeon]|nr:hypothetical protein [Candidatus Thorarchaeota archaeon]
MVQTLTKSVEKNAATKFGKIVAGYKTKITAQDKTIKEFEEIQEKSVRKLYHANLKIKDYGKKEDPKEFIDLPSGSNRKKLSI